MSNTPICRNCGKQLRRHYDWIPVPADKTPAEVTNERVSTPEKTWRRNQRFAQGVQSGNPTYHVNVWRGRYGYAGSNAFCNGACAKAWAVEICYDLEPVMEGEDG